LEHKVRWEATAIAFYRLYQGAGFHQIEPRQIGIEHDLLAADNVDSPFDQFQRHGQLFGGGR
jgi:hypothetical protein